MCAYDVKDVVKINGVGYKKPAINCAGLMILVLWGNIPIERNTGDQLYYSVVVKMFFRVHSCV